jgi:hypothetical protein
MKNSRMTKPRWALNLIGASALLGVFTASSLAADEHRMIDEDATQILSGMTAYLGGLNSFSADFDSSTDVITADGQKLKLTSSGNVLLERPGHFAAKRLGALSEVDLILDGETLTLYGHGVNAYLQLPATTIDGAVASVRDDIGFEVPGGDLLSSTPLELDMTDTVSGTHIGMTTIGGVSVHHLAFRGSEVDWQIWIKDDAAPVPVKYVVTSKLTAGAPEYELLLTNWNTEPQIDENAFSFSPPAGAQQLNSISFDAAGNIIEKAE